MPPLAVFFDLGGVLIDAAPGEISARWRRLVGEFLAPRLGGDVSAWGDANGYAAERMFARMRDPGGTPRETIPRLWRLWLREMCERVGVDTPRDAGKLAEEIHRWVCERAGAPARPDAVE